MSIIRNFQYFSGADNVKDRQVTHVIVTQTWQNDSLGLYCILCSQFQRMTAICLHQFGVDPQKTYTEFCWKQLKRILNYLSGSENSPTWNVHFIIAELSQV